MPLRELELDSYAGPLPGAAEEYIAAAKTQIDHFHYQRRGGQDIPAFVPCDFEAAYRALRAVIDDSLPTGNRFCEWGSGFGIVAGLASMLGLDACGIEIHAELVREAERLAKHFDLAVQFVCGSLVPPGGEELASHTFEFAWLSPAADQAYDELGLEVSDFDIIFAYPWPGEEEVIYSLFSRYAATGALLLTYHGIQGIRVQRKVPARRR
jgi:hypothetical protein